MSKTIKQLADEYASRLRQAKRSVVVKSASSGATASVTKSEFRAEVLSVVREIDGLIDADSKKPLSEDVLKALYTTIDNRLALSPGTFELVKKGSVEMGIQFDKYVAFLMQQVVVEE